MSRIKTLLNFFLSFLICFSLFANDNKINEGIELSKQAYLKYDKELLLQARSIFENEYKLSQTSLLPLYYITLIDYKLLEMSLRGESELFDKYYDPALQNAEMLRKDKQFSSEGKILMAAIYMMKIANSSLSAVTLSPKIHTLLDEVQSATPDNPYTYVIRGMMKYNTPGILGGSYEDALNNFNQAAKLFQKISDPAYVPWGYAETLAWKGRTLQKLDNLEAAEFTYKKALDEEADFAWVKNVLLPQLQKEISEK